MLWNSCAQYASKFGKLSSGHRTGKGQFSFQSQRKTISKNVQSESEVAQLFPTLCNSMDCSPPGSSIHEIFQVRVLDWVAISFSRGSSWPRDQTRVSGIAGRFFTISVTMDDSFTWNYAKTIGKIIHINGFQVLVVGGGVNDEGAWILRVMKSSYILLITVGT